MMELSDITLLFKEEELRAFDANGKPQVLSFAEIAELSSNHSAITGLELNEQQLTITFFDGKQWPIQFKTS